MNTCNTAGIQDVSDLPIDNLESLPEYLLAIREITDSTGNTVEVFTKVPTAKLIPSGNLQNVFALISNNDSITIPENQVVAGYVANEQTQNIIYPANKIHPAMFLMFNLVDGQVLCQSTGILNIMGGTKYIVGAQYFLGTNGQPTTDSTVTGQKLFIPLTPSKLLITL